MSDTPNDTTERPPFEETEAYKKIAQRHSEDNQLLLRAYENLKAVASDQLYEMDSHNAASIIELGYHHMAHNLIIKTQSRIDDLRQRYERGEL